MNQKYLRILNLATLVLTVTINALANILPFNGMTTGELSNIYPVLFTPAPYVFSIWGLIYFALFAFAIYQLLPSQRDNPIVDKIGGWFIVTNLLNAAWMFTWHYQLIPLSILVMVGILVSLLVIYQRLQIGKIVVSPMTGTFVSFPFSLYLGWISVATIANASVFLYALNWNGFGLSPVFWTVVVILVGAALGILMIRNRNEIVYPLVIIWAFAGIQFKSGVNPTVGTVAGAAALLVLLVLMFSILRARQSDLVAKRSDRAKFVD